MITNLADVRHERLVQDMQRTYDGYAALLHQRIREFNAWLVADPDVSASDALARIAEILSLDELRLETAGYGPRPLQDTLKDAGILGRETIEMFKTRYRQEARN